MTSPLASLDRALWRTDLNAAGRPKRFLVRSLRLLFLLGSEVTSDEFSMRAMSLVYTTLLSLVPLLAVSFSVLKGFGIHTKAEIFLYQFLEPLGPRGVDLSMKIIQFVENVKVSVLGSIGLVMLMYTAVSLAQQIESALNYLWGVNEPRSFSKRLTNYLSFALAGPVVIFSVAGVIASVMSTEFVKRMQDVQHVGTMLSSAGKLVPYFLICAVFTLIYLLVPNTRVRVGPALRGGLLAALLWVVTGWAFTYVVVSSAKYSAIYSGFATLVFFLMWLHWSFLILLTGARTAYYAQYPRLIDAKTTIFVSEKAREEVALLAMIMIGRNFYTRGMPWSLDALASRLGLPVPLLKGTLGKLTEAGLVVASGEEPPSYVPKIDPEKIMVKEILDAAADRGSGLPVGRLDIPIQEVRRVIGSVDSAVGDALASETLKDLVLSDATEEIESLDSAKEGRP